MPNELKPTQADRDAAKEAVPYYIGELNHYGEKSEAESWANFYAGKYDHFRGIKAFARHRIAHQPDSALVEELAAAVATPRRLESRSAEVSFELINRILTALGGSNDR